MKKIITLFLGQKKIVSIPHYVYISIVTVFVGICIYEGILFLVSKYSFLNALYVFLGSSILYVAYNLYLLPIRTKKQCISKAQKNPFFWFLFSSKQQVLFLAFIIVWLIFLVSFYFVIPNVFIYASSVFVGMFLGYVLLWERIDISHFWKTDFTQKTLLKIGVITLSLYLVFVSSLVDLYDALHYKNLILLVTTLLYIIGFLCVFTDTSHRVYRYFCSKEFHKFALNNTYNFLSLFFISFAIILLLGKFGAFDGTRERIVWYFSPTISNEEAPVILDKEDVVKEVIIEPTPTPIFVTKLVSEVFFFWDRLLEVGSDGEDVAELQNALTLLWAFTGTISGEYGEDTKVSLTQTLQSRCNWPETTRGILWNQARQCLYSLTVDVPEDFQDIISDEVSIISNEVTPISN